MSSTLWEVNNHLEDIRQQINRTNILVEELSTKTSDLLTLSGNIQTYQFVTVALLGVLLGVTIVQNLKR
jgi:hypothetical protein